MHRFKEEYGLGRGHAMAIVYVIKNGAEIGDKHVGTDGVHRDEANVLTFDGEKEITRTVVQLHQYRIKICAKTGCFRLYAPN